MHRLETSSHKASKLSFALRKTSVAHKAPSLSNAYSPIKKELKHQKSRSSLDFCLSENTDSPIDLYSSTPMTDLVVDIYYAQARQSLSRIEDPLWKCVCGEVIKMMGPLAVLKIWDSQLGSFSTYSQDIEIYCKTEDAAQFVQQYAFVILEGLRGYFPTIKNLSVKMI
jgi:hypothetical protein